MPFAHPFTSRRRSGLNAHYQLAAIVELFYELHDALTHHSQFPLPGGQEEIQRLVSAAGKHHIAREQVTIQDGHAGLGGSDSRGRAHLVRRLYPPPSFRSLMEETDWERYGVGHNPKCANCMAHCGFEGTAVDDTFAHPLKALDGPQLLHTGASVAGTTAAPAVSRRLDAYQGGDPERSLHFRQFRTRRQEIPQSRDVAVD